VKLKYSMMMKSNLIWAIGLLCACCVPTQAQDQTVPFDLQKPTLSIILDSALREVSGLSVVPGDTSMLACIQDESGVIYFLRKTDGSVACKIPFKDKGDFEGIEVANKIAYAIKSNGDLYTIDLADCLHPKVSMYPTKVPKERDVESLAIDEVRNLLIFVTKEDPKNNQKRTVFGLDRSENRTTTAIELFSIDPIAVRAFGEAGQDAKNWFSPSGVSIDPLTRNIYIISSASRELCVFDTAGKLLSKKVLEKSIFAQPEGISFDTYGNLYISNEAKDSGRPATLLYFQR
jgi:uncharacterized protein YjiK